MTGGLGPRLVLLSIAYLDSAWAEQRAMRLALLILWPVAAERALLVGDSWAEYALESLQEHCLQVTSVVNLGIAGSRASQWATRRSCATAPNDQQCCQATKSCSLANVSSDFQATWVSVGGNDFFEVGCTSNAAWLDAIQADVRQARMTYVRTIHIHSCLFLNHFIFCICFGHFGPLRASKQVIADVKTLVAQSSIVVTGYSIPSSPLTWHPSPECSSIEAMRRLNSLVRRAAELEAVTFVNVSERMGGNATAWSEPSFFLASRRVC